MLRRVALVLGGLAALAVATGLVLLVLGIRLDVGRLREPLGRAASERLGRTVEFRGPIHVVPSLWPTLEIEDLRIEDPLAGGATDFARFDRMRARLAALPLLRGEVRFLEILAEGVRLDLGRRADGTPNWAFDLPAGKAVEGRASEDAGEAKARPLVDVRELALSDIRVTYRNEATGASHELAIARWTGGARSDRGLQMRIEGTYQDEPFSVSLVTGTLADLLVARPEYPLDFSIEIAGVSLKLEQAADAVGAADGPAVDYRLTLAGERLDRLDPVVGVALPPLGPLAARARVRALPGEVALDDFELRVGETRLEGRGHLAAAEERPRAELELSAPLFRLEDFDVGDWSATGAPQGPAPEAAASAASSTPEEQPASLVDPDVMRQLDATLTLRVDDVRSGADTLGRGELRASLENGRLAVAPLVVHLPGGAFELEASLEARPREAVQRLAVRMEAFDLGVLARRADPDTEMGGVLDVDAQLASRSPYPASFLAHATGTIDLSLVPRNVKAGIVDLWALNLLASVIPFVAPDEAQVNCVVALLDAEEGRMREQALLIDTTRVQVRGEVDVDFGRQRVAVALTPRPKRPQFFSLGTPIQVKGSFSDFGVGVRPRDLAGTVVRLATDTVTFPLRAILQRPLPADGTQACAEARRRPAPATVDPGS